MFVSESVWKNSVNVVIGGVGTLISSLVLKSLNSIKKIPPKMMVAMFNGNPCTTIITCYSLTTASDDTDLDTFYNELILSCSIPKHNVQIIGGDINAQIRKNVNNKFSLHNLSNGNGEHTRFHTRKWSNIP